MRIGKWAAAAAVLALLAGATGVAGPGLGEAQAQNVQYGAPLGGTIHALPDGGRMLVAPDGRRFLLPPAAPVQQGGAWPPAPTVATVAPPHYVAPAPAPSYVAPAPAPNAGGYSGPTYSLPPSTQEHRSYWPGRAAPSATPAPQPARNFSAIPGNNGVANRGPYVSATHTSRRESDQSSGFQPGDPRMYAHSQDRRTPVPPTIELNIAPSQQEESLWCWAAAAQQAVGWANRGKAPAQCEIVAMVHGIDAAACCADPKGVCNVTGEIPEIIQLVRRFGGQAQNVAVPRTPKEVYDTISQNKTLLIRLRPQPREQAVGIRHMIVVRGVEWFRMPNGRIQAKLLYNDPLGEDQRAVDFDEILGFFEQAMVVSQ